MASSIVAQIDPQPLLPSAVPRDDSRSGYNCEFVQPPPSSDIVQTECPVCLQILRKPCLISCTCGQKYCEECIELLSKNNKPCPLCNKPKFNFIRDYALERYLKDLDVWCSHKEVGCEWRGKLREFEVHLNQGSSHYSDPSVECQYIAVECNHKCGEWFQRRHVNIHKTQQCKKRPYSCDYCKDYDSTFEDVTETHYPQCSKYPIDCPNKCREYPFERQKIESHLVNECPLTLVDCLFHYAGCDVQVPRKDMPEHMKETATHLTLLASITHNLVKENQKLRESDRQFQGKIRTETESLKEEVEKLKLSLVKENQELRETMKKNDQQYHEKLLITQEEMQAKHTEMQTMWTKMQATENETESLKEEMKEVKLALKRCSRFPKVYHVKITEYNVYLPAFYTHPECYKMCVRVVPNGCRSGKGIHVSIYTYLMKCSYDKHLKWPFRGNITIQIVNQAGDHDHVEKIISYNDMTLNDYAGRVISTVTDRSKGLGEPQFLSHSDLEYNAAKKTQYLKDNHLMIHVVKIDLL